MKWKGHCESKSGCSAAFYNSIIRGELLEGNLVGVMLEIMNTRSKDELLGIKLILSCGVWV